MNNVESKNTWDKYATRCITFETFGSVNTARCGRNSVSAYASLIATAILLSIFANLLVLSELIPAVSNMGRTASWRSAPLVISTAGGFSESEKKYPFLLAAFWNDTW